MVFKKGGQNIVRKIHAAVPKIICRTFVKGDYRQWLLFPEKAHID